MPANRGGIGHSFHGINAMDNTRVHNGDVNNTYASLQREVSFISDWPLEKRNEKLLEAANGGQIRRLELLIQARADLDYKDEFGHTALHKAVQAGFQDCVELLIDYGADINAVNQLGWTALCVASYGGDRQMVEYLINKRANVRIGLKQFLNSLINLTEHVDIMGLLLDRVHNDKDIIEAVDEGGSLLIAASCVGNTAAVKLLLDRGANIEAEDSMKSTALSLAVVCSHTSVVEVLLDRGANIETCDSDGFTPLCIAAIHGHSKIADLLLSKGANMNVYNPIRALGTPLMVAARLGYDEVVKVLIDRGANLEALDNDGMTAFLIAASQNHIPVIELLLSRGANPEVRNKSGLTALEISPQKHRKEVADCVRRYALLSAERSNGK